MTHINTPGEMECFLDQEFCEFELSFTRNTGSLGQGSCILLTGVEVNGNTFSLDNPINILNIYLDPPVAELIEHALESALDAYGLLGDATVNISLLPSGLALYELTVSNSNASSLKLLFSGCAEGEAFTKSEDCCEPGAPTMGDDPIVGSPNPDLFYEHITYTKLNISRIDMGSNCQTGFLRNEYQYDANHRLTHVRNTFFNPEPVLGLFNSSYTYDPAGNLVTLKRYGLEDPAVMGATPFLIDDLAYIVTI